MSRVGLSPVNIPEGVTVALSGNEMTVKGKFGELSLRFVDELEASIIENQLWVKTVNNSLKARKLWGTFRSLAGNLIKGVGEGFTRVLDIMVLVTELLCKIKIWFCNSDIVTK